jgi:hypothetical protein
LLLDLAVDADAGPGNRFEAGRRDLVFTFHADAISALIDPVDGLVDRAEEFGVGLLQGEAYVKVAFLARLIDPVAALRSRLSSRRANGCRRQQFFSLFLEKIFVFLYI